MQVNSTFLIDTSQMSHLLFIHFPKEMLITPHLVGKPLYIVFPTPVLLYCQYLLTFVSTFTLSNY